MMNTFADFLSYDWSYALGWTLLHSLWQAPVILLLLTVGLRLIPTAFARRRYALACGAFGIFILVTLVTFAHQLDGRGTQVLSAGVSAVYAPGAAPKQEAVSPVWTSFSVLSSSIESSMPAIISGWMLGVMIFTVRIYSGIRYTLKLRSKASILEGDWSTYMKSMAQRMGITRLVTLTSSAEVTAPMVIGYLKPVIILPIGMLSGLTTEQIETVLIHELAHIRRHDYVVNFVQSLIETVFFFNPFTRILSNIIRREREYCCDDLVIRHHGGTKAYAYALAQLAAARFSAPEFAMNLGEGKYQLLNRIKRIMEISVKNHSGRIRIIVPAIVIVTAMMCISWLGIHSEKVNEQQSPSAEAEQDTVIGKTGKDEKYLPVIPPVPDTVPFRGSSILNEQQWEEFSKAFEEKFRKRFENLGAFHEEEFAGLIEELEEKFQSQDWADGFDVNIPQDVFERLEQFNDSAVFQDLELQLERLKELEIDLKDLEGNLKLREGVLRKFERVLREELINDGYLSETETIESLQWSDDSFKVNGKPVSENDLKKYQALQKKYMGEE